MTADRNDDDDDTKTSVEIDISSTAEPTITVTGVTLTDEALAAATNAGLLPADAEPSTLEARLILPADSEPSTIEPTLGVRALAGPAAVAVPSPSSSDDDDERTTLNVESRLLGAFDQASQPPPVKHLPSTSTTPKKKVSKSPTIERQRAQSDPTLNDERNDETIDRPPPSKAMPVAVEADDADTSVDARLLSGGLSLSAVADAAADVEDDDENDDEIPTSVRLEVAPLTMLSSSDLVTDAGSLLNQLPTAPAPFPISEHVRVEDAPLEPRGPKGTVKVVADGTGSTPIAHADLPGRWPPVPSAVEPTMLAPPPRRRVLTVVLLGLFACIGTLVFLNRVQSKTADVDTAGSPAASSDSPPPPSASASVTTATSATADPQEVFGPPTTTAAAPSAPEPAKARVAPPHKPPPAWRPPAKPAPAPAPAPPTPAPKGSSFLPLHI